MSWFNYAVDQADRTTDTYWRLLHRYWYQMGPDEYIYLLILIGVFGWILMKNASKK